METHIKCDQLWKNTFEKQLDFYLKMMKRENVTNFEKIRMKSSLYKSVCEWWQHDLKTWPCKLTTISSIGTGILILALTLGLINSLVT